MNVRQIVLDTETTGMRVEDGNRIIEIGCVELINRKLTGNHFHRYINPNREVEAGALAVHGLSNQFLNDKPLFHEIAKEFMEFIRNAELIIHNAPFDVGFLNDELKRIPSYSSGLNNHCTVTDTLALARKLHVGQRNSLDALCKRYFVDNSKRDFHGALLDSHLLAQVYLAMTGGQGSFFDTLTDNKTESNQALHSATISMPAFEGIILMATSEELEEHANYLSMLKKQGKCLWSE